MDFATSYETLKFLGASPIREYEYRDVDGTRQRVDIDLLSSVKLPLDAAEWCALCMKEGSAYLGGCCANLSGVQELLNKAFWEGGWMPLTSLKSLIEVLIEHDDVASDEYPLKTDDPEGLITRAKTEWESIGPIDKVIVTWHAARPHMTSKVPKHVPHEFETEDALYLLASGIRHLNAHFLVRRVLDEGQDPSPVQLLALYRLWPALKTAYERFQDMNTGPMSGWVFINPEEGPEALASGDIGISFYPTLEAIKGLVLEWSREAHLHEDVWGKEQRESFKKLVLREVRVSVEKGLEFLPGDSVPVMSLV